MIENFLYIIPYALSISIGYLSIHLLNKREPINNIFHILLATLLGLAFSAYIVFFNLILFNQFIAWIIIGIHLILLSFLLGLSLRNPKQLKASFTQISQIDIIFLIILAVFIIPTIIHGLMYPLGGWDAWSNWNLKSKFIFLGAEHWQNMLHPALKESNIQYPFLLPLINTWGFSIGEKAIAQIPMINSILFTFLQAGILGFGLKQLTKQELSILPATVMLSLFFFVQNASSQYSDVLVSTYGLSALICLLIAIKEKQSLWFILFVILAAITSFTKTEGMVLSILLILVGAFIITKDKLYQINEDNISGNLILTGLLAFLPIIIFKTLYCPTDSGTFINGLTSSSSPANINRIGVIFMFWLKELISLKWMGIWIVSIIALGLRYKYAFKNSLWIIPAILLGFLGIANGYYYVNTHFNLPWWLSVTVSRELFILLPFILLWTSLATWPITIEKPSKKHKKRPA